MGVVPDPTTADPQFGFAQIELFMTPPVLELFPVEPVPTTMFVPPVPLPVVPPVAPLELPA
jgi:hypothetical protein